MNNTPQEELTGIPSDANKRGFSGVWIPAEIWLDDNLPGLAKMLYAEIASFEKGCWKRSDELREPLGVSQEKFQKLCRQLKDGGYITERRMFGRIVRKTTLAFCSSTGKSHQKENPADEQPEKPADEQAESPAVQKEYTKNKERIHINAPSAIDDSSKEYGRADINELIRTWSEQVHDIQGDKTQRRYAYNLIRKYGAEGAQELVERVAAMKRKNDRFAPNIAKLSDLMGKYSKLDKLEAWEQRQQAESKPNEPQYTPPPAYFRTPDLSDYGDAWREVPDEEHDRISQQIKDARAKMPFFNKGGKK